MLGNLPNPPTANGVYLNSYYWAAVGLTASSTDVQFVSLTGYFTTRMPNHDSDLAGGIFSDAGGSPDTLLSAFTTQTLYNAVQESHTLATSTPFTLSAATSYWFVLWDPPGGLDWNTDANESGNGTTPAAASGYTYLGYLTGHSPGAGWTTTALHPSVQIEVDQGVPEPTTAALLALGGGYLLARARRRMRLGANSRR